MMKKITRVAIATTIVFIPQYSLHAQLPVLVKDINQVPADNAGNGVYPQNLADINGTIYFFGQHPVDGLETYISNGTTAGTHLLTDLNLGQASLFHNVNGTCFFFLNSSLYKSDGTASGTTLVKAGFVYYNFPFHIMLSKKGLQLY